MDKKTLDSVVEALIFYKSVGTWPVTHETGPKKVKHDGGARARTALILLGIDEGIVNEEKEAKRWKPQNHSKED